MVEFCNVLRVLVAVGVCLHSSMGNTCPDGAKPFYAGGAEATIRHATVFSVDYYSTYKVVKYDQTLGRYRSSYPVAALQGEHIPDLILYQCGTNPPTVAMPGVSAGAQFVSIPPSTIALPWTGVLPFVEWLGLTKSISLIDLTYISSPCGQLLEECDSSIHMAQSDSMWAETARQRADVVFSGSSGLGFSNSTPSKDIMFEISRDPGILNRAEWVRFMALFFNEEVRANELFNLVSSDYTALEAEGQRLKGMGGANGWTSTPRVAWVSLNWQDKYQMTTSAFKRDITQAAGGRLVSFPVNPPSDCNLATNSDGTGSLICEATAAGLATFQTLLQQADVIVDETYITNHVADAHTFASDFQVSASNLPALARDPPTVYRIDGTVSDPRSDGTVGTHWFEGREREPNQVLADMMIAIWGSAFQTSCTMKYLRRSFGTGHHEQDVWGHDDCPLYRASGTHDCEGVHTLMHEVPICTPQTEADDCAGPGLGLALLVPLVLSLRL